MNSFIRLKKRVYGGVRKSKTQHFYLEECRSVRVPGKDTPKQTFIRHIGGVKAFEDLSFGNFDNIRKIELLDVEQELSDLRSLSSQNSLIAHRKIVQRTKRLLRISDDVSDDQVKIFIDGLKEIDKKIKVALKNDHPESFKEDVKKVHKDSQNNIRLLLKHFKYVNSHRKELKRLLSKSEKFICKRDQK